MDLCIPLVGANKQNTVRSLEPDDPVQVLEYDMESRGLSRSD